MNQITAGLRATSAFHRRQITEELEGARADYQQLRAHIESCRAMQRDLSDQYPTDLNWPALDRFIESAERKLAEFASEVQGLAGRLRRLDEAEREAAVLIKPQPKGTVVDGWDV